LERFLSTHCCVDFCYCQKWTAITGIYTFVSDHLDTVVLFQLILWMYETGFYLVIWNIQEASAAGTKLVLYLLFFAIIRAWTKYCMSCHVYVFMNKCCVSYLITTWFTYRIHPFLHYLSIIQYKPKISQRHGRIHICRSHLNMKILSFLHVLLEWESNKFGLNICVNSLINRMCIYLHCFCIPSLVLYFNICGHE